MKRTIVSLFVVAALLMSTIAMACTGGTKKFTVTFDSQGGTNVVSQKIEEDGFVVEPRNPVKQGFEFDNWYWNDIKFDFNTPVTEDIILVAKWIAEKQQITVTFDVDGGSEVAPQSIYAGQKATRPYNPTKTGTVFFEWYKDANHTQVFDFNSIINQSITIYALFTIFQIDGDGDLVDFAPGVPIPSHLIIPERVGHIEITEIKENTKVKFNTRTAITEITFPSSITMIGIAAFTGMANLAKINFPEEGSLYISAFAFQYAPLSGTLVIAGSIHTIQANAFQARAASGAALLHTVEFTGTTPPEIFKWEGDADAQYWSFVSGIFADRTGITNVYVPVGLVDLYKSDQYLGKYYNDNTIVNFQGAPVPQSARDPWVGLIKEKP